MLRRCVIGAGLIAAVMAVCSPVQAGPPLLCHRIQIGSEKSLPWGNDTFEQGRSYDASRVVDDTLDLLTPEQPVLARMETIRRAVLYINKDAAKADRLLGALACRALDAEVVMDAQVLSLRYFDAGYFAAALGQAGIRTGFGPGITKGVSETTIPGYTWAVRGWKLAGGNNDDMAIGLALMTADTRFEGGSMFLDKAVKASRPDDAARNGLLAWIATVRGTTLEALRAKYGTADAGSGR